PAQRLAGPPARRVPGGPPGTGLPGHLRRRDPRVDRAEPAPAAPRARRRHDDLLAAGVRPGPPRGRRPGRRAMGPRRPPPAPPPPRARPRGPRTLPRARPTGAGPPAPRGPRRPPSWGAASPGWGSSAAPPPRPGGGGGGPPRRSPTGTGTPSSRR